jgi:hypothetical protein
MVAATLIAINLVPGLTTFLLLLLLICFLSSTNRTSSIAITALRPSSSSAATYCHLPLKQASSSSAQWHAQAISRCLRQCSSKGVIIATRASPSSSTTLGRRAWPSLAGSYLLLQIKPLALCLGVCCHTLCCCPPLL